MTDKSNFGGKAELTLMDEVRQEGLRAATEQVLILLWIQERTSVSSSDDSAEGRYLRKDPTLFT